MKVRITPTMTFLRNFETPYKSPNLTYSSFFITSTWSYVTFFCNFVLLKSLCES